MVRRMRQLRSVTTASIAVGSLAMTFLAPLTFGAIGPGSQSLAETASTSSVGTRGRCSGQAKWRLTVNRSSAEGRIFASISGLNARPGSTWEYAMSLAMGDANVADSARLTARPDGTLSGRLEWLTEANGPLQIRASLESERGQRCGVRQRLNAGV